jgi:hypothetical protein
MGGEKSQLPMSQLGLKTSSNTGATGAFFQHHLLSGFCPLLHSGNPDRGR